MDVPSALRSLDLSREDDVPDLAWLTASCEAPPAFWSALTEHARRTAPPPRSRPGVSTDLYHDAIGRHATTARVAFLGYERRAGFQPLSYAELAARASACAHAWARLGVKPGAVVALVLPLGAGWLVAFAASLRLGLVVSFLAPAGERALVPRLDALAPDHVVFDLALAPPVGPWAERALAVADDGPPHPAPAHVYPPGAPCARLFSPLRAPLAVPVPLLAETAYQNALRDAVFVYRLGVGDLFALPGFHPQQHHPAAILASLVAGATFLHIPFEEIEARPALLQEHPVSTLGVTPALCEVLRQRPLGAMPALRHWLRSVDEPLDFIAYSEMIGKNGWRKLPVSNVLVDAAAGGAVLFSARRPGSVQALALPAPGRAFAFFDVLGGEPAVGGTGVFVPMPGGDPGKDGWFILARRGAEHLWGSTVTPRRAGRVFPGAEVEALVSALPGVAGACVTPVPTGDPGGRWAFVLVVFTGAAAPRADLAAAIERAVRDELGEDFVPDRVHLAPLHPRREGRKVDAAWCRRQYSGGLLARKAAHPLFCRLTELRGRLLGA